MINKIDTKRWAYSLWSRFLGLIFWSWFTLFSIGAKDIWTHAIFQVILVILTFVFLIVIPDKIIFGKYLVEKKVKRK